MVGIVYMRTGELDVKAQVSFFFMSLGVGKMVLELKRPELQMSEISHLGKPNQHVSELILEKCYSFSRLHHAELHQRFFFGYDEDRGSVSNEVSSGLRWCDTFQDFHSIWMQIVSPCLRM